jgi:glucose/arabinose dehydrogenase
MFDQIPVSVLEEHEGQWIVWDQDDRQVVGCGTTLDEAEDQARQAPPGHLLRVHHVLPHDAEISGML